MLICVNASRLKTFLRICPFFYDILSHLQPTLKHSLSSLTSPFLQLMFPSLYFSSSVFQPIKSHIEHGNFCIYQWDLWLSQVLSTSISNKVILYCSKYPSSPCCFRVNRVVPFWCKTLLESYFPLRKSENIIYQWAQCPVLNFPFFAASSPYASPIMIYGDRISNNH